MFDRLTKGAMARLESHAAAVKKQRDEIERERAGDDPREWAGRFLKNSEGYSTSPAKAAENTQKEYARARREWEKVGAPMIASAVAMMVARERRDEAAAVLKAHEDSEFERQRTRVHPEVRSYFATMFDHGVQPERLANVRVELIAIVSDLIRWDGADQEWSDADNPVPDVFRIYAKRLLEQPNLNYHKPKSVPGEAVVPKQYSGDTVHYMINKTMESIDSRAADVGQAPAANETQLDEDVIASRDDTQEVPLTVASPPMVTVEPVQIEIAAATPAPIADVVPADVDGLDEYELPSRFRAAAAKIRKAAIPLADDPDFDRSMEELNWAIGNAGEALSDDDAIGRVEAKTTPGRCTPFRYFIETARSHGRRAGIEAYREATIRRLMFTIATESGWEQARKNLGLE